MLLDVSYECAIEYSIGSGSSIEYGNRMKPNTLDASDCLRSILL
jgi:hypothetical protein